MKYIKSFEKYWDVDTDTEYREHLLDKKKESSRIAQIKRNNTIELKKKFASLFIEYFKAFNIESFHIPSNNELYMSNVGGSSLTFKKNGDHFLITWWAADNTHMTSDEYYEIFTRWFTSNMFNYIKTKDLSNWRKYLTSMTFLELDIHSPRIYIYLDLDQVDNFIKSFDELINSDEISLMINTKKYNL